MFEARVQQFISTLGFGSFVACVDPASLHVSTNTGQLLREHGREASHEDLHFAGSQRRLELLEVRPYVVHAGAKRVYVQEY